MNFSYVIDPVTRELTNGTRRVRTAENENSYYWSDDKSIQKGRWVLGVDGTLRKLTPSDSDAESVLLRINHAPEIVAEISALMSNDVPQDQQVALMSQIITVGSLLMLGSYSHALMFVRAEIATGGHPAEAAAALLKVETKLQAEIQEYYDGE